MYVNAFWFGFGVGMISLLARQSIIIAIYTVRRDKK